VSDKLREIRGYGILIVLLAIASVALKDTIEEKAKIEVKADKLQEMLDESERIAQTRAKIADDAKKISAANLQSKQDAQKELAEAKDEYAKLLASKAENKAWADQLPPPDVIDWMQRRDAARNNPPVRSGDVADRPERGLLLLPSARSKDNNNGKVP
jgi:hypothetical protein